MKTNVLLFWIRHFTVCVCVCVFPEAFMCKTEARADVVILVDGSWSIGRVNFRLVRAFLESLVKAFDVDLDRTRIGEGFLQVSCCQPGDLVVMVRPVLLRVGPVQRRAQDRVAPEHPRHQRGCDGGRQEPALQGREHADR